MKKIKRNVLNISERNSYLILSCSRRQYNIFSARASDINILMTNCFLLSLKSIDNVLIFRRTSN